MSSRDVVFFSSHAGTGTATQQCKRVRRAFQIVQALPVRLRATERFQSNVTSPDYFCTAAIVKPAAGSNRARREPRWISHCRPSRRRSATRSARSARGSATTTGSPRTATAAFRTISTAPSPTPAGWACCIPQEYGGAGLGVTEAALMMQTIAESGAGMSGASALHMNIFGLNPVVVFGSDEQKKRMLPPLIAGKDKACFAVTEPNVGLDTLKLKTKAVLRRRALRAFGPEDLDFDRAGREQDAHPRAHHAARTGHAPHRRPEPVLHRPRPALRRCPRNPEDGPQRRRLQRAVHRRAAGAGRRPHRRGGQGLSNTSCTA